MAIAAKKVKKAATAAVKSVEAETLKLAEKVSAAVEKAAGGAREAAVRQQRKRAVEKVLGKTGSVLRTAAKAGAIAGAAAAAALIVQKLAKAHAAKSRTT